MISNSTTSNGTKYKSSLRRVSLIFSTIVLLPLARPSNAGLSGETNRPNPKASFYVSTIERQPKPPWSIVNELNGDASRIGGEQTTHIKVPLQSRAPRERIDKPKTIRGTSLIIIV